MVGGWSGFFFHFLYFVFSSPGGRLSVVAELFFYFRQYRFSSGIFGTICGFVFYELLIFFFCLLQVVQAE